MTLEYYIVCCKFSTTEYLSIDGETEDLTRVAISSYSFLSIYRVYFAFGCTVVSTDHRSCILARNTPNSDNSRMFGSKRGWRIIAWSVTWKSYAARCRRRVISRRKIVIFSSNSRHEHRTFIYNRYHCSDIIYYMFKTQQYSETHSARCAIYILCIVL